MVGSLSSVAWLCNLGALSVRTVLKYVYLINNNNNNNNNNNIPNQESATVGLQQQQQQILQEPRAAKLRGPVCIPGLSSPRHITHTVPLLGKALIHESSVTVLLCIK